MPGAADMEVEKVMMDIKLAATGTPARITFEPIGLAFEIEGEESLTLRIDPNLVPSMEIHTWPNGMGIWLPYPGESDYIILDSEGREITRLW